MATKKIFTELKRGIAKRGVVVSAFGKLSPEEKRTIQNGTAKLTKRVRGLSVAGAEEILHAIGTYINDWENKIKDGKKKEGFKHEASVRSKTHPVS